MLVFLGVYTKEDFYYVMRYVTDTGEEGPPSIVSDMATRTPDGVLKLTLATPTGLPSYIKKSGYTVQQEQQMRLIFIFLPSWMFRQQNIPILLLLPIWLKECPVMAILLMTWRDWQYVQTAFLPDLRGVIYFSVIYIGHTNGRGNTI